MKLPLALAIIGVAVAMAAVLLGVSWIGIATSNNQTKVQVEIVKACADKPDPIDCGNRLAEAVTTVK